MKALPAVFFPKHPRWLLAALAIWTAPQVQAQNYPPAGAGVGAPGAVQQPYYRQAGSAYVPPGTTRQATLNSTPQYQPGFGTPPNYKPPTVKPTSTPSKPKSPTSNTSSTTSTRSKPVSLETKVARLEKNDARQDQRLNHLEFGKGGQGQGSSHADGGVYTVRPGDTLWRIAERHNTSINELKAANRISGETITVGQSLIIPGYSGISLLQESPSGGAHIVRPGDTFSQIAQTHGLTMDTLARANPSVYPDRLLVGERIVIPGQKVGTTPAVLPNERQSMSARLHIVKPGESLGAIAKGYGVSTASMAAANKLKDANLIAPGQKLLVPGGSASPAPRSPAPVYPPADSDTVPLPGAGLYATSPAPAPTPAPQLATVAPAPESAPAPKPVSAPVSSNRRGIVAYRLERGDDIHTVSNLFNTTPERIRELNKMAPDAKLKEGDEVVVPSLGAVSLN
ncbi:LysM domain-containing protein [Prosthecobacter debontii]|uniref:LysM domain-containing protein n=1 Tax=Prosthecobacter debontii TaxID=48467 RepID=A0A1T4YV87_9BACT|nr:LysM peptidoglycan-binding domain-containing protein [Prosthecobacter debontii]SKB05724.1 LysM domain-containing protein [Prosthecobacter debontii]